MDAHANLAISQVATAPIPADSGTVIIVTAAQGSRFPATPFNATVWPGGSLPDPSNAEIVRVTNIVTDTMTVTRTQEGTSARTIIVGDYIAATITAQTLTDIEDAVSNETSARVVKDDALSQAVSVLSQGVSVLSQAVSVADAALSVRIDTQSQGVSVLSQKVSILSQSVSALSNAVSVADAALSVRIDTQSQSISALSQAVSVLSQGLSALSQAVSVANAALSNKASAVSAAVTSVDTRVNTVSNLLSQTISTVSVLSQNVSLLSDKVSILSQGLSVVSQKVSVVSSLVSNLTSAHNALSNVVSGIANGGSVTSTEVSAVSAQAASALSDAVSVGTATADSLSNAISLLVCVPTAETSRARWTRRTLAAAATVSASAMTNIAGLSISVTASGIYRIEAIVMINRVAGTIMGYGMTFPGMTAMRGQIWAAQSVVNSPLQTASIAMQGQQFNANGSGSILVSIISMANVSTHFQILGVFQVSSSNGVVQLQMKAAGGASAATARVGSYIEVERLG